MNREKNCELKDRLREALDYVGMKPIELADITGIPKSMVSYYLSGKAVPRADRIYDIAKALDVSEAWLMGFDVTMEREFESLHLRQNKESRNQKVPGFFPLFPMIWRFFDGVIY